MAYYVYILESEKTGEYYIGATNDVRRRFVEHNSGLSRSTAPFIPFVLKRVERFDNIKEAYKREQFLKAKKNKRIIELIVGSSPDVLAEQEVGIPIAR